MAGDKRSANESVLGTSQRLLAICITLPLALSSLFSFLNNVSGWQGTLEFVIVPMLSMEGTFGNPAQTWRAIDSTLLGQIAFGAVSILELLVFVFCALAIGRMTTAFKASSANFAEAIRIAKLASIYAIFVWIFFFFTVAGDWFLIWQNPNLKPVQFDAVNYAAVALFSLICLHILEGDIATVDRSEGKAL